VLAVGFNLDWTLKNVGWCKMRLYISQVSSSISLSCVCNALLDQYFVSCQGEKWRRLSKLSITRLTTCLVSIVWILYALPIPILIELIPKGNGNVICSFINRDYIRYLSYFGVPFLNAFIPIIFCAIVGMLTYRNISLVTFNRHRQQAQQHLTAMILLQIIFLITGSIPYGVFYIYIAITSTLMKSSDRLELEGLVSTIVSVFSYCSPIGAFFVYYFSSKAFCGQIKQLFKISPRQRPVQPS
jgi:uncharacterized membrane protein YciS (DUF1049 family)